MSVIMAHVLCYALVFRAGLINLLAGVIASRVILWCFVGRVNLFLLQDSLVLELKCKISTIRWHAKFIKKFVHHRVLHI